MTLDLKVKSYCQCRVDSLHLIVGSEDCCFDFLGCDLDLLEDSDLKDYTLEKLDLQDCSSVSIQDLLQYS